MRFYFSYLVSCAFLGGCATITKGSSEDILIITEPAGAQAESDILIDADNPDLGYIGCMPTPCSITLGRRQEAIIEIKHDDYAPFEAAIFSDVREVRERREQTRQALLKQNAAVGTGLTASYYAAYSVDQVGKIILPSTGVGIVLLGSLAYSTAGSYVLLADATDTITGAANSLYPNPLAIRLSKQTSDYPQDPNVEGVRQRRNHPSPKPPLNAP